MKRRLCWRFTTLGALLFSFPNILTAQEVPLRLTALNSLQRVVPTLAVQGKPAAEVKAARNEYEAFQVLITAGREAHLKNIRIRVTDLVNGTGKIDNQHVAVFREAYVYLPHSSPRAVFPPGLYPDPLLPLVNPVTGDSIRAHKKLRAPDGEPYRTPRYSAQPIHLYPGQHCMLWVDIYVPPETAAGLYRGAVEVSAEGGVSASLPVSLTVWDFTLPDTATHRTHLGEFSLIAKVWGIEPTSEQFKNTERAFCRELARHRVNPPIPHSLLPEVREDGSLHIDPERHQQLVEYMKETHQLWIQTFGKWLPEFY